MWCFQLLLAWIRSLLGAKKEKESHNKQLKKKNLAEAGLCYFFVWSFSSWGEWGGRWGVRGLLFIGMHGLLIGVASLVVEDRL